jgi:GH18 family chitinase
LYYLLQDWEYPGVPGEAGNIISPADTDNFLKFLQLLRKKFGSDYRISAAVSVKGFMGADGKYLNDTKAFSKVLDYITIMVRYILLHSKNNGRAHPTRLLRLTIYMSAGLGQNFLDQMHRFSILAQTQTHNFQYQELS